jgi:hypothetical protein
MYTGPSLVSSVPWRAMRVGKHESNVSTPRAAPAQIDGSSAMPRRWLGLSAGRLVSFYFVLFCVWVDGWMGRGVGWLVGWLVGWSVGDSEVRM